MRKTVATIALLVFLIGCQQDGGLLSSDVIFSEQFIPGQMGAWQIEGDSVSRTAVIDPHRDHSWGEPAKANGVSTFTRAY